MVKKLQKAAGLEAKKSENSPEESSDNSKDINKRSINPKPSTLTDSDGKFQCLKKPLVKNMDPHEAIEYILAQAQKISLYLYNRKKQGQDQSKKQNQYFICQIFIKKNQRNH